MVCVSNILRCKFNLNFIQSNKIYIFIKIYFKYLCEIAKVSQK